MFAAFLLACDTSSTIPVGPRGGDAVDSGTEDLPGEPSFDCAPEAEDVNVLEGERVEVQLACTGSGVASSWALVAGPDGVTVSSSGLLEWNTDLESAGNWTILVSATAQGVTEQGRARVSVVDAWDARGNVPPNPSTYTHEYGLPVLFLDVPGNISSDGMVPASIVYAGRPYDVEAQLRGAASLYYPKLSYRLDFAPDDEFEAESDEFPDRRSVVLITLFDDNSYVRQKLVYDVWNSLADAPAEAEIYTEFVVVYLNGEYWGLYLLADHIDGEFWEDIGHREDGNLYKSVDHSANFYADYYGSPKSSWHSGYEKKEGTPPDDFSDLDAFVRFVAESSDADFNAGIEGYITAEQVFDWWSLVVFLEADDSGGKNAYFYNDPEAPGFHFAPWDFNHSVGQTWQTDREPATYDYDFTSANGLFLRLLRSEVHGSAMSARFDGHRASPMSVATLHAHLDGYYAAIDPAARRDWDKWEAEYRAYGGWSWRTNWTDYDEEVRYVYDWLDERHRFVERWDP